MGCKVCRECGFSTHRVAVLQLDSLTIKKRLSNLSLQLCIFYDAAVVTPTRAPEVSCTDVDRVEQGKIFQQFFDILLKQAASSERACAEIVKGIKREIIKCLGNDSMRME